MRIVKLGGSLLDLPDLRERLVGFLNQVFPPKPTLILVGGGSIVESIRRVDQNEKLDETSCHWLCVQLMNSTAELLHLLLPNCDYISSAEQLKDWLHLFRNPVAIENLESRGQTCSASNASTVIHSSHANQELFWQRRVALVAPKAFYSPNLNASALPCSWQTTSDSIATLLAKVIQAEEILLLKSSAPPIELSEALSQSVEYLQFASFEIPLLSKATLETVHGIDRLDYVDRSFLESLPTNLLVGFFNLRF